MVSVSCALDDLDWRPHAASNIKTAWIVLIAVAELLGLQKKTQ